MSYAKYGNTIAEFVKRFRKENDLSQGDLAKMMKVHRQYVSNIERGVKFQKSPILFCMRFRQLLDPKRQKYLDDLIQEAFQDSTYEKLEVRLGGLKASIAAIEMAKKTMKGKKT